MSEPNPVQVLIEAFHVSHANPRPCPVTTIEKGTRTTEVVHLPTPFPHTLCDDAQDYINDQTREYAEYLIRTVIHAHLDPYRQYDAYHDNSTLTILNRQWDSKGGTAYAGDLLLSCLDKPHPPLFDGDVPSCSSYSVRMKSHLGTPIPWLDRA